MVLATLEAATAMRGAIFFFGVQHMQHKTMTSYNFYKIRKFDLVNGIMS